MTVQDTRTLIYSTVNTPNVLYFTSYEKRNCQNKLLQQYGLPYDYLHETDFYSFQHHLTNSDYYKVGSFRKV